MAVTGRIPTLIDLRRSHEHAERFVGRVEELAALKSPWPPVTIVLGEPGGGKTRLLAEAARHARVSAVTVACHPCATTVPLEPLLTVVRELRGARPKQAEWDRPNEASRLEAIRGQLSREHGSGLLVQLDDVHWADDQTLDAIAYLADRLRDAPLRWHIASRPGDVRVERLAVRLGQIRLGDVVRLGEFGIADFRAFVAATSERALDESSIGELYALSGGNPLYAEQLIISASAGAQSQSAGLDALLAERIRSLDDLQLRVARAIAVNAGPISMDALGGLTAMQAETLAPIVRELESQFIAKVSPRGAEFRHDLLRRACYGWTPEHERADLHERLARMTADPWLRVHHLDGAARREEAAQALLAHGLTMLDRADREEAKAALEGAARRAPESEGVLAQAKAGLAALRALSGELDESRALMEQAEADAGDVPLAVKVDMRARYAEAAFEGSDDTAVATEFLKKAIADAERSAREALPRLFALAGAVTDRSGDSRAALDLLLRGMASCTATTPPRDRIRLKSWLGVVHGRLGDLERGTSEAEDAAEMAAAHRLSAEFAHACVKCCYLADLRGDREAYESWCRRGLDHPGVKLPRVVAALQLNLATAVQDRGALEEALALDVAASDAAKDGSPALRARVSCSLALASAMLGRFGEAASVVAELERLRLSDRWRRAVTFVAGRVAEMRDELSSALAAYEAVARGWVGIRDPEGTDVRAKAGEARVLYALGRYDEVEAVWAFARDGFERGWPLGASLRAEIEGYALIANGYVEDGAAALVGAARTSKERFRSAYLVAAAGLAKADRDLINTAIVELEEMGAHAASEGIRRKARGIGFRPRSRPRTKRTVTTSDLRIASLIRAGKTNAEIGTQLGLSTKTVEHYVSSMLGRFGLRSRAQLAATIGSDAD